MALKPKGNSPVDGIPSTGFVKVLLLARYMTHGKGQVVTVSAHEARTLVAQGKAELPQVEFK